MRQTEKHLIRKSLAVGSIVTVAVAGSALDAGAKGKCQRKHEAKGCKLRKGTVYRKKASEFKVSVDLKVKAKRKIVVHMKGPVGCKGQVGGLGVEGTATVHKVARVGRKYAFKYEYPDGRTFAGNFTFNSAKVATFNGRQTILGDCDAETVHRKLKRTK